MDHSKAMNLKKPFRKKQALVDGGTEAGRLSPFWGCTRRKSGKRRRKKNQRPQEGGCLKPGHSETHHRKKRSGPNVKALVWGCRETRSTGQKPHSGALGRKSQGGHLRKKKGLVQQGKKICDSGPGVEQKGCEGAGDAEKNLFAGLRGKKDQPKKGRGQKTYGESGEAKAVEERRLSRKNWFSRRLRNLEMRKEKKDPSNARRNEEPFRKSS